MKNDKAKNKLEIVISGSPFHGNFGSMAMVVSTIKKLSNMFPYAVFYKGSIFKNEDIRNYRKLFNSKKLKIYGFNSEGFSIKLTAPLLLFHSISYFQKADLIMEVPGEIPSDISLFSQYARFLLAKILKKPLIIFGCSLGPYKHTFTERVAKKLFSHTDLLIIREKQTARYLNKLGVTNYQLTADTAFLLSNQKTKNTKNIVNKNTPYIGLSVKGPYFSFQNYRDIVLGTIELLLGKTNENILIIPHSQDDIEASNMIFKEVNNPRVRIIKNNQLTPEELKEIISFSSFYIGSRVHSSIAAVSNQVPTVFLIPRNDHRGRGTMEFFDLDKVVVDPSKSKNITIKKIMKIFEEKAEIKKNIVENLPSVKQLSKKNFTLLGKFINNYQNDN